MARSNSAVEVNKFVGGLVTEASPLNFPDNATLDEDNFVLNKDGTRQRRLGMDFENDYTIVATTLSPPADGEIAITSTRWRNAGGDALKNLMAVQVGNELRIFDMDASPISSGIIYTKVFTEVSVTSNFSYAVVDGILVIATGLKSIYSFKYENSAITESSGILLIRDLFGVEDITAGVNLREGSGVSTRPTGLSSQHTYNLRNQTFAVPRLKFSDGNPEDPILTLYNEAKAYPSNADSVVDSLFSKAASSDDPVTLRFQPVSLIRNPVGNTPAPRGYFIIDALARGVSRNSEAAKLFSANPGLNYGVSGLPVDTTPGGATVITEYAGRVWYSGFSGGLVGGDANSPRMASYVLFSQLVEDPTDILSCYQDGDPTGPDTPELLDTDGGFIRIEGAYGISGLVAVGKTIMVLAANGVWSISGGSDYGFKATNYLVNKITNHGCTAPNSVVVVDDKFMYWGDDGIYTIGPNQYGDYLASSLTETTIQKFYDEIDGLDKQKCKGLYDSYEHKVRWLYRNRINSSAGAKELVLDIALQAFYPCSIKTFSTNELPLVASQVQVPAFTLAMVTDNVTVNNETVTVSGAIVSLVSELTQPTSRETLYIAITQTSPTISFAFSLYRNESFRDWVSIDNVGLDANAYMITGWMSGNDTQRNKQVPYVTFHFIKTEDGFVSDSSGDYVPTNQSSCIVQSQWDWANSVNSGRWGKEFQAYRFKRHYFPTGLTDTFNNGFYTTSTKSKLRGKGKVLSMLFKTEPDKNLHIAGWSMLLDVNQNV